MSIEKLRINRGSKGHHFMVFKAPTLYRKKASKEKIGGHIKNYQNDSEVHTLKY